MRQRRTISRRTVLAAAAAGLAAFPAVVPARQATPAAQPGTDATFPGTAMFRGNPARTGANPGPGPSGEPAVAWVFPPDGAVQFSSSPALDGNVLYVGSHDSSVYALDARTGERITSVQLGAASSAAQSTSRSPIGGAVLSSPVVDGGTVYVGGADGLYALDAQTLATAWSYKTDAPVDSSPAVVAGMVYFAGTDGFVYALDAATGGQESSWSFPAGSPVYSSPAVVDGVVYVGGFSIVHILRAPDGTQLGYARLPADAGSVDTAPAVYQGAFYAAATGGSVFRFDTPPAGTDPNSWLPGPRWRFETGGDVFASPAVADVDGRILVFVVSADGNLYAIDAASGVEAWRYPGLSVYGLLASSPVIADGNLYVGSGDGTVHAIDPTTHQSLNGWPVATNSKADSTPVVANGWLYIGTLNGLVAIGD